MSVSDVEGPQSVPATPGPAADEDTRVRPWWEEHTRVAGSGFPGRHAARPTERPLVHDARALDGKAWSLPASWQDRVLLGPAQLAVVVGLLVLAVGITGWWLVRAHSSPATSVPVTRSDPLVTVSDSATPQARPTAATSPGSATVGSRASPTTVTVDVAGKVRRPGLQVLASGARVADALAAAGGARPGVDLTSLNLAQVLLDGQQVLVGQVGATGVAAAAVGAGATPGGSATGASGPAQLVDLNTASADQLDSLPEVGPVTAASILSWRAAHGGFTSVDELLEVDGIGEVTLGKIAPFVTV